MPSEVSTQANTKSASTKGSSTATGPRRFRGDVPAFNPTGQSPHIYAQQMQQQYSAMSRHHLQQQPYPQQPQFFLQHPGFVYGAQIPAYYPIPVAYPEQMYQLYPYFVAANPFAATPLPYMSTQMNGMGGAYMHHNNREKHPSKSGNSPYANNAYLNSGYSKSSPQSWTSRSQSPNRLLESASQSIDTEGNTAHTTHLQNSSAINNLESKLPHGSQETTPSATASTPDSHEDSGSQEKKDHSSKLPLVFNSTLSEYTSSRRDDLSQKHKLLAGKSDMLIQRFPSLSNSDSNDVLHKNGVYYVNDLNSGSCYTKEIFPPHSPSKFNELNDNDANDEKASPGVNWATVLQKSANKKQAPKKYSLVAKSSSTVPEAKTVPPINPVNDDGPKALGLLTFKMLFDPDFDIQQQKSFAISPRGLTNTGNICYMNAVLQCLMFCEPFNKILHYIDEKAIGFLNQKSPTPIIDATINFIKDFLKVTSSGSGNTTAGKVNDDGIIIGRPLSPQALYSRLVESSKFQHLKWGQQEDAEEFLNYLLDGLHEDFVKAEARLTSQEIEACISAYLSKLNDNLSRAALKSTLKNAYRIVKNSTKDPCDKEDTTSLGDESAEDEKGGWAEVGSGKKVSKKRVVEVEPSPITKIFGGQFRSVLTVPKGKESQSITVDPFRCMLVDVSDDDVNTIEDALWKINEVEKIPYKIDGDREVLARKQTFIDQLPEVLLLQLKRFSYQHEKTVSLNDEPTSKENPEVLSSLGTIEKLTKDVRYTHNLSIPEESLSPAVRNSGVQNNYKLVGVIYHHGRNAEGGHYTCDVSRNPDGKNWLRIDDTSVEKIAAESVIEKPQASDKSAYILMYQRVVS